MCKYYILPINTNEIRLFLYNKTMERLLNDREGGSGNKTTQAPQHTRHPPQTRHCFQRLLLIIAG